MVDDRFDIEIYLYCMLWKEVFVIDIFGKKIVDILQFFVNRIEVFFDIEFNVNFI